MTEIFGVKAQEQLSASLPTNVTYTIVSTVAFLLGVPERIFQNEYTPPKLEIYKQLQNNKPARIIRNLCMLRTKIEQNFKKINECMKYEYKTMLTMPDLVPYDAIMQLSKDGIDILKSKPTYQLVDYIIDINRNISDKINNCKELFPMWLNWNYLRDIFLMPDGFTQAGTKVASDLYYANKQYYPYHVYMNWQPKDEGNIFYTDKRFVVLLYEWNGDRFTDFSKVSDVKDSTKGGIYDFLYDSVNTVVMVDCENSDPYRLCATLDNLDSDELDKISKIVLYDDVHTSSAWKILSSYIDIPVERIEIERVMDHKSLVDTRLVAGTCTECYKNHVDSFIIVSSDSDFSSLLPALPEARFIFMVEHGKFGTATKELFARNGIFYCYIDEFYSGNSNDIKITALIKELNKYIKDRVHLNTNDMLNTAMTSARVFMSESERKQFYDKYIRNMYLEIDKDGNISINLKTGK